MKTITISQLNELVNAYCTCGGKGPELGACPACMIWHAAMKIMRDAYVDPDDDPEVPKSQCPKCGKWELDYDGFGILAHVKPEYPNGCGYCSHPSTLDGKCGICGEERP